MVAWVIARATFYIRLNNQKWKTNNFQGKKA